LVPDGVGKGRTYKLNLEFEKPNLQHLDPSLQHLDPSLQHLNVIEEVRGLLCSNCNTGIGNLQDSIEILEEAINYLKENGSYAISRR